MTSNPLQEAREKFYAVLNAAIDQPLPRITITEALKEYETTLREILAGEVGTLLVAHEGESGAAQLTRKFHNDGIRSAQNIIRTTYL